MLQTYKDLIVWQRSIELVREIYRLTSDFPKEEMYGLISQLRRAAVSIPSNIAEGQGRKNIREYIQFLYIAKGSGHEIETQLYIVRSLPHLKNIDVSLAESLLTEVQKMIYALIESLQLSTC